VLNVPNLDSPGFRLFGLNYTPLELPRHFYHYTPQALSRLAERSGFRVQRIQSIGNWDLFTRSASLHWKQRRMHFMARCIRHPATKVLRPIYGAVATLVGKGEYLSAILVLDKADNSSAIGTESRGETD